MFSLFRSLCVPHENMDVNVCKCCEVSKVAVILIRLIYYTAFEWSAWVE